jgi:hypothetical protein
MMIARWHIEAKFGHKSEVIASLKKWNETFGTQIGWTADKVRMLTGSVGAPESLVTSEIQIKDLAELNSAWEKLGTLDGHAEWSRDLEPHVVSGSTRWEIHRVL